MQPVGHAVGSREGFTAFAGSRALLGDGRCAVKGRDLEHEGVKIGGADFQRVDPICPGVPGSLRVGTRAHQLLPCGQDFKLGLVCSRCGHINDCLGSRSVGAFSRKVDKRCPSGGSSLALGEAFGVYMAAGKQQALYGVGKLRIIDVAVDSQQAAVAGADAKSQIGISAPGIKLLHSGFRCSRPSCYAYDLAAGVLAAWYLAGGLEYALRAYLKP